MLTEQQGQRRPPAQTFKVVLYLSSWKNLLRDNGLPRLHVCIQPKNSTASEGTSGFVLLLESRTSDINRLPCKSTAAWSTLWTRTSSWPKKIIQEHHAHRFNLTEPTQRLQGLGRITLPSDLDVCSTKLTCEVDLQNRIINSDYTLSPRCNGT